MRAWNCSALVDGRQIRAARALLGITQRELAQRAGLHPKSIAYYERMNRLSRHLVMVRRVREALEAAGVRFVQQPGPGCTLSPGV